MSPIYHKCSKVNRIALNRSYILTKPDTECSWGKKVLDDATYVLQTAAEIERLRSRIDDAAVCKHASSLNDGRSCTIEHSSTIGPGALMGSANYHARIRFHDGYPSWLLRVPRVASFAVGLPSSLVEYLYRHLEHSVTVYMALEQTMCSGGEATENEKAKVWSGLADILIELEKHSFPKADSLCFQSPRIEVSAVASDRFLVLTPTGPFATSTAYYGAFAEQYLELIADGRLYTEYPVNAYLVYQREPIGLARGKQMTERFYLKHVDDKGDHILVDEQLNITSIIDWQMTPFGPFLVTADMNALCDGKFLRSPNDLVLADMLRRRCSSDLASNMNDEKVRRYFLGPGLRTGMDVRPAVGRGNIEAFGVVEGWSQWKESTLKEYETDERLKSLIGFSSQMKDKYIQHSDRPSGKDE
ncbi:aminoglycoside phosphotransferase protein [Rutstroemia sp. NJR-2017a WRK4]|nr:aminoglycoside phosphotransferase protein [Rutstroemia sp. NJR-2017a WRK4]